MATELDYASEVNPEIKEARDAIDEASQRWQSKPSEDTQAALKNAQTRLRELMEAFRGSSRGEVSVSGLRSKDGTRLDRSQRMPVVNTGSDDAEVDSGPVQHSSAVQQELSVKSSDSDPQVGGDNTRRTVRPRSVDDESVRDAVRRPIVPRPPVGGSGDLAES